MEEDHSMGRRKDRTALVAEERRRRGRGGEVGDAQAPRVGSLNELVTLRQVCRTQPGSRRLHIVGLQPMSPGVGGHLSPQAGELREGWRPDFKSSPSKVPDFHPELANPSLGKGDQGALPPPHASLPRVHAWGLQPAPGRAPRRKESGLDSEAQVRRGPQAPACCL